MVATVQALVNSTHIFVFYTVVDSTISNLAALPPRTDDYHYDAAEFYFINEGSDAGLHVWGTWNLGVRSMNETRLLPNSAAKGTRDAQRYTLEMVIKFVVPLPPTKAMPGQHTGHAGGLRFCVLTLLQFCSRSTTETLMRLVRSSKSTVLVFSRTTKTGRRISLCGVV